MKRFLSGIIGALCLYCAVLDLRSEKLANALLWPTAWIAALLFLGVINLIRAERGSAS